MPDYLYACDSCALSVDVTKPMADSARKEVCPLCSAEMRRVFAAVPTHFKGGCWAKDGYSRAHVTFKYKDGSKSTVPYKENKLKKEDK